MFIDAYEDPKSGAVFLRWAPSGPWRYRGQGDVLEPGCFGYDAERWYLAGEDFSPASNVTAPEHVYYVARWLSETGAIELECWESGDKLAVEAAAYIAAEPRKRWDWDSCPQCAQPVIADYNRDAGKLIGWNSDGQQVHCEGCATLVERSFDKVRWSPWRVKGVRR
jgi:hypothetical protein